MDRKWIIGNWKMHGSMHTNALRIKELIASDSGCLDAVNVFVAPPAVYLSQVHAQLGLLHSADKIGVAAQLVAADDQGAYTGQCSASMLKEFGVQLVLVGHSECRQNLKFDGSVLVRQIEQVLLADMRPVLCVGESVEGTAKNCLYEQLEILRGFVARSLWDKLLVAYEPVWAIGTGKTASVDFIQDIHLYIQGILEQIGKPAQVRVPVLYGGSVSVVNSAAILCMSAVAGVLVGGASLRADDFLAICRAAPQS